MIVIKDSTPHKWGAVYNARKNTRINNSVECPISAIKGRMSQICIKEYKNL